MTRTLAAWRAWIASPDAFIAAILWLMLMETSGFVMMATTQQRGVTNLDNYIRKINTGYSDHPLRKEPSCSTT